MSWSDFFFQIHCAVSVSNGPVFENCGSTPSSFFFAGIKVNSSLKKCLFIFKAYHKYIHLMF